ncbi:hypothetical protein P1N98_10100 [Tsukamurella tyrosinosolvens]|uniref:hypothetical protein n=2 Tax=Tsukamurella tyrosinosolvens TaxID=57704 RepID=UPI0024815614|nr:hypothetical protein [Tsukamurella tyrosinosolvens]WEL91568.1 hypothetical protein P1N98_10100 [Tsukamurella tyrosinosolvens]
MVNVPRRRSRVAAGFRCESMPAGDGMTHPGGSGVGESISGRGDLTEVDKRATMRHPTGGAWIRRTIDHIYQIDHA